MLGRASTRESHNQSRTRASDITGARMPTARVVVAKPPYTKTSQQTQLWPTCCKTKPHANKVH